MTDLPSTAGTEMSEENVRSLLESKGHGVLSMGAGNRGYGLPMTYRYDEENERVILGFVNAPGSKKQEFTATTEEATLTVYDFEDVDAWESVVVTGTIHPVDESDFSDQFVPLFFLEGGDEGDDRRLVDFDEYDRAWYELRIDDVSGRYSG